MIPFDEIQPGLTPSSQIETDWTGGLSALPTTTKRTLLVGHKTTSGSATAGVPYQLYSENHAIALFGAGSDIAISAAAFFRQKNAGGCPLFGVAYAEGAGLQAAGTVTLATNASSNGVLTVWLAGRRFQVAISSGDTPTVVGDLLAALINAHPNLCATAANVTGTVTVTHRIKGTHGNTVGLRCEITCTGMTATPSAAFLAGGTVPGDPTSVLAGLQGERFHVVVLNTYDDATTAGKLVTDRELQSSVSVQKWGLGIVGHCGTGADAQTLATAMDSYRAQVVHLEACDQGNVELAAAFAAHRALKPGNQSVNRAELVGISSHDRTAWPTAAEIEADLQGGVTPIRPRENGKTQVVRSVVTRQTLPIPFRDHMPIEISDYADEAVIAKMDTLQGRPLKSGSPPASATTLTPNRVTAALNEVLLDLDNKDWLQGVQDSKDAGHNKAEINGDDPNRVDAAWDFWPVAFMHRFAGRKTYITAAAA